MERATMSAQRPSSIPQLGTQCQPPKPVFWKDTYRTHPLTPIAPPPLVSYKVPIQFSDVRAKVVSWR
jgi:hypothetical protein